MKAKGEQRMMEERAQKALQLLGMPREVDPHTALLEELHRTVGLVEWLAKQIHGEGTALATNEDGTPTQKASVWFRLWQQERDRAAKVAESCARAGVEERRVAIVEDQGRLMTQLLRAVLNDLGVPLDDKTTRVVRRHLELTMGEAQRADIPV